MKFSNFLFGSFFFSCIRIRFANPDPDPGTYWIRIRIWIYNTAEYAETMKNTQKEWRICRKKVSFQTISGSLKYRPEASGGCGRPERRPGLSPLSGRWERVGQERKKIAIFLSLGLHKGRPCYKRSLQPFKENIQHFTKWNLVTIFYFCGYVCSPGSGSVLRIRIQIEGLHWIWIRILIYNTAEYAERMKNTQKEIFFPNNIWIPEVQTWSFWRLWTAWATARSISSIWERVGRERTPPRGGDNDPSSSSSSS